MDIGIFIRDTCVGKSMGQTQAVDESVDEIANKIAGSGTEIIRVRTSGNRHEVDYDGGCIQAHKLPDGWEFTGFGTGWFSIKKE